MYVLTFLAYFLGLVFVTQFKFLFDNINMQSGHMETFISCIIELFK